MLFIEISPGPAAHTSSVNSLNSIYKFMSFLCAVSKCTLFSEEVWSCTNHMTVQYASYLHKSPLRANLHSKKMNRECSFRLFSAIILILHHCWNINLESAHPKTVKWVICEMFSFLWFLEIYPQSHALIAASLWIDILLISVDNITLQANVELLSCHTQIRLFVHSKHLLAAFSTL